MKRAALVLAIVLPILATLGTLAGARQNRAGGRAAIELDERELHLLPRSSDNSAAVLVLNFQRGTEDLGWLDRQKLESLGYDCSVDPDAPGAAQHYRHAMAKRVFFAFERREPSADVPAPEPGERGGRPPVPARPPTRLVPIDAAADAATLESRYPDAARHLITPGLVRLWRREPHNGPPRLEGTIVELYPSRISVAREWIPAMAGGKYSVALRYGARYEPWVERVTAR